MAHSKLRQLARVSYYEPEDPSFDEYIYCSGCRDYVYDMCPQHGPLLVVPDTKVPAVTSYPPYVPRAALTIPKAFLHIARSCIPGAGLGVFSTVTLPNGIRFGPYRGVVNKNAGSSYCWQIYDNNNKPCHVVDGGDGHRSNWMRFINCSRHWSEQNLVAFQYKGQIYYRTVKIIPRNTELLVFYGSEAAYGLGIDLRLYNCQPQINELAEPSASDYIEVNKEDMGHKCKVISNVTKRAKISRKNTKREPTSNSEKVKGKYKLSIKVDKISNKLLSNTKTNSTEAITSNKENVNEMPDLCKDGRVRDDQHIKKPFICNASNTPNNFTCDQCGGECKYFTTIKILKKHIEENKINHHTINTSIQKTTSANEFFYCDICQFKTKVKLNIQAHLNTHAAKTVHVCHVCEYRSIFNSNLKKHLKTHIGEKSFSCHLCEYTCTEKRSLKRHMNLHNG